MSLIISILDCFCSIYRIISATQRATDPAHEISCKEALEDMAAIIREQMALTNRMLQHMETNNNVVVNIPTVNPQFQGLAEF